MRKYIVSKYADDKERKRCDNARQIWPPSFSDDIPQEHRDAVLKAVREFSDFDPHDTVHQYGEVTVLGQKYLWELHGDTLSIGLSGDVD
jgi:hypothetical protein